MTHHVSDPAIQHSCRFHISPRPSFITETATSNTNAPTPPSIHPLLHNHIPKTPPTNPHPLPTMPTPTPHPSTTTSTPVTTTYYLPPPSLTQSQPLQPPPSSTTWPPPPTPNHNLRPHHPRNMGSRILRAQTQKAPRRTRTQGQKRLPRALIPHLLRLRARSRLRKKKTPKRKTEADTETNQQAQTPPRKCTGSVRATKTRPRALGPGRTPHDRDDRAYPRQRRRRRRRRRREEDVCDDDSDHDCEGGEAVCREGRW